MSKRATLNAKPYLIEISLLRDKVPSFDEYPFSLPVVKNLRILSFHRDVTFQIGENGAGKSTLMESIAQKLSYNPEGGNKNSVFTTRDTHSNLHEYVRISKSFKVITHGIF